ncbi:hypothetical protein ASE45_00275 [Lysobacter sp. Root96]|nr:hypothetical protein ASE45_00275 [Lysobacter sp. Root96]
MRRAQRGPHHAASSAAIASMTLKRVALALFAVALIGAGAAAFWWVRFDGGGYCYDVTPAVRWRGAIYTGECDSETGCHFIKLDDNGLREYLGLAPIRCPDGKPPTP